LGEGGGALINQGQHLLDIWTWLFGMPKTVYAAIPFGKYNDFQVDDEATITMKYPNQMTGVFMLTTGEAVNQERLEIVGSKGKILLEDGTLHIWKYSEDACEYAKTAKVNSRDDLTIHQTVEIFEKQPEPYVQMLQNFAEAVKQGKPLVAPGEEGSHALELTNAAYLSAWKRCIVQLPMDLKEYQEELNLQIKKEGAGKRPQSAH
jgi:predicted dehydrogenase